MTTTLPISRGPLTEYLFASLRRAPHHLSAPAVVSDNALADEDLQLALYCCYELHYQGFSSVSDDWEWEPSLIAFRSGLEELFERQLRQTLPDYWNVAAADVPDGADGI